MFAWEGWWTSDLSSFFKEEIVVFTIDVIEESEILMISLTDFEKMTIKIPVMDRYFRILFQNSFFTKGQRLLSSLTYSAEEKSVRLAESNTHLFLYITQNLIASYLGITPETLIRIKNSISRR